LAPLRDDALAPTHDDLRALLPQLGALAEELSALGIGATVQHDDLHDGNVLTRDGRPVIFDWGDACVTHPFLSLWIVRRVAAYRTKIAYTDPAIVRLVDTYLEGWSEFGSTATLRRAAEIGARLGSVTRALCWHRVVMLNEGVLADEPDIISSSLDNVRGAMTPER
ncbi:MAG: phosphotransferase, partial [Chloroflexota bacterium]